MNSSVKFLDPIVSVFDAFAGLRLISLTVAGSWRGRRGRFGGLARAAAADQQEGQHEGCGGAAQHAAAIIPRPPDGGRGNAQGYLTKPAFWR